MVEVNQTDWYMIPILFNGKISYLLLLFLQIYQELRDKIGQNNVDLTNKCDYREKRKTEIRLSESFKNHLNMSAEIASQKGTQSSYKDKREIISN